MPKFPHLTDECFSALLQRARGRSKYGIYSAYPKSSPLGVSVDQMAEALTAYQQLRVKCETLRVNLKKMKESSRIESVYLRRRNADLTAKLAESEENTRIARQEAERLSDQLAICQSNTTLRYLRRCILGVIRRFHPDKTSSISPADVTAELNELLSILRDGQSSDDAETSA